MENINHCITPEKLNWETNNSKIKEKYLAALEILHFTFLANSQGQPRTTGGLSKLWVPCFTVNKNIQTYSTIPYAI